LCTCDVTSATCLGSAVPCLLRYDEFGRRKRSKQEDDKRAREQAALQRLYGGTNLAPSEQVRHWLPGLIAVPTVQTCMCVVRQDNVSCLVFVHI
jgi:hypothetical protein